MALPTLRQVKNYFYEDPEIFTDRTGHILLTKLEEHISDEQDIDYGTDEYADLEDIVFKSVEIIIKESKGNYT
jgi:hypothetical protein